MNKEEKERFEWMVAPTTVKAWGEGGGLMVWLSVAFGLVGAGGYIASVFFGSFLTLLVSWLIVTVLKNIVHFLHLNKKSKLFSMASNSKSAWIARGTVFTILFSLFGLIQLLIMYFAPEQAMLNLVFEILTCLAGVGIIVYESCLLASNRAVPFWQDSMVPVTFPLWAVVCGLTLILALNPDAAYLGTATAVAAVALLIAIVFAVWSALKGDEASAASAKELLSGSLSGLFWIAGVVIGALVTIVIAAMTAIGYVSGTALLAAWVCAVIGTLGFTLCIFKAGKYRSLI